MKKICIKSYKAKIAKILIFILLFSIFPFTAQTAEIVTVINVLLEPAAKYQIAYPFSGGIAVVHNADYRCGIVDSAGSFVVRFGEYDYIDQFSDGMATVGKNEQAGVIDRNGRIVVKLGEYDYIGWFSGGMATVYKGEQYGAIDRNGRLVVKLGEYNYISQFSEGLATVESDGLYGVIDKNNNFVVRLGEYDYIDQFSGGMATVYKSELYGAINNTGRLAVKLGEYNYIARFTDGVAKVGNAAGQFGIIDKNDRLVVQFGEYDSLYESGFSNGMATVYKDGKAGAVDNTGFLVVQLGEYDEINQFSDGMATVYKNGKAGVVNNAGRLVVPFGEYDEINRFSNGMATVYKNRQAGIIDNTGRLVLPFGEYDEINQFSENMAWVIKDGKYGIVQIAQAYIDDPVVEPDDPVIPDDPVDPGGDIKLPDDPLAKVMDEKTALDAIKSKIDDLSGKQKEDVTEIDLLTLFSEEAIAQAASTTFSGGGIKINQTNIRSLQSTANKVKSSAEKTLADAGIEVMRGINADVKFKTKDTKKVTITVEQSSANTTADNVRVETPKYAISISKAAIKEGTKSGSLVITVEEIGETVMGFTFASLDTNAILRPYALADNKDNKEVKYKVTISPQTEENIKYSFEPAAGDVEYQAVLRSNGTPVGGKYNPVTKKIDTRIQFSDTYTVKENKKNFKDISAKSREMQDAINILASKGIINGTSVTTFSPDGAITRAEITALIVRTLSRLNENADGGFKDVKKSDWFCGAVGSAKKYGIINGTSATTFAPNDKIRKDQIIAIAARTLRSEMKWKTPKDTDKYLNKFTDKSSLPKWGTDDFALASMADLIVLRTDRKFNPSDTMTRGEAAIVLYRVFMKIW